MADYFIKWPQNINKILLIFAMDQEANEVMEKYDLKLDYQNEFTHIYIGYSKNNLKQIILAKPTLDPLYKVQSIGSEPIALCVYIAIQKYQPDIVINAGTSGGVKNTQNLQIGEIVVAKKIQYFKRKMIIQNWANFVEGGYYNLLNPEPLQRYLKIKGAIIGTDNSFTNDNSDAVQQNIDCIEMEAASIIRVCHLSNVPFTAIKIVSDVEMEDQLEREKLFVEFLKDGVRKLGNTLFYVIENIDEISNSS